MISQEFRSQVSGVRSQELQELQNFRSGPVGSMIGEEFLNGRLDFRRRFLP